MRATISGACPSMVSSSRGEGRAGSKLPPPGRGGEWTDGVVVAGTVAVGAEEGGMEMLGMATAME
eukprot:12741549-Prorocentrum_lima.AAC.1